MTLRVLVVGLGSIGERHLRCFGLTGRATLWACEPNKELRRRIENAYAVERCAGDLDDFLENPPDAAVICTPSQMHVPMATRLATVGAHLLIEKPLSTSTAGVDELAGIAEHKKITVAVAYVLRTDPSLSAMRDALRSGRFGKPVQLVFASGQNFPFFRPAYRDTYYASRQSGGGAIQDALTHGVNAAEWLIGPMTDVAADAGHQILDGVDVEDTAHVIARHGDVMACYSLNQYQAPNETTFTVVCTKGTLRCQLHRARWSWQDSPESDWTEGDHYAIERDDMFVAQASHFLDAIEQQTRPHCTLAEGLQTLQANLAMLRAADQRKWQTVGPAVTQTTESKRDQHEASDG